LTLPKANKIKNGIENELGGYYILCLSQTYSNILMWSHYAEHHKGVVLKFRRMTNNLFSVSKKINYSLNMPSILNHKNFIENLINGTELFSSVAAVEEIFSKIWHTKSIDWKYEEEWRIVLPATPEDIKAGVSKDYYDIPFSPDDLLAIYLGCKIEENQKEKIINILKNNFPLAKIYQMKEDESLFKLNEQQI
jgi:hypothetical protein